VGVEVYPHAFLNSALDGGEWSALRPGYFNPRETAHGTHKTGSLVGLRAGLHAVTKRIETDRPGLISAVVEIHFNGLIMERVVTKCE
jgi:hypothetical protein